MLRPLRRLVKEKHLTGNEKVKVQNKSVTPFLIKTFCFFVVKVEPKILPIYLKCILFFIVTVLFAVLHSKNNDENDTFIILKPHTGSVF